MVKKFNEFLNKTCTNVIGTRLYKLVNPNHLYHEVNIDLNARDNFADELTMDNPEIFS